MTATNAQNWFIRNLKTQKVFLLFAHSIRRFLNYLNLFNFIALRIFLFVFINDPLVFLFINLFFLFSLSRLEVVWILAIEIFFHLKQPKMTITCFAYELESNRIESRVNPLNDDRLIVTVFDQRSLSTDIYFWFQFNCEDFFRKPQQQ